jgi:hypothetical protein
MIRMMRPSDPSRLRNAEGTAFDCMVAVYNEARISTLTDRLRPRRAGV